MSTLSEPVVFNYDESKVPAYQLPELLEAQDGSTVQTRQQWTTQRRPEILALFEEHVYGKMPTRQVDEVRYEITEQSRVNLPVPALRRQVTARFVHRGRERAMSMLIHLPVNCSSPPPVFIGLNFDGNHTVHDDPAIHLPGGWVRNHKDTGAVDHRAVEAGRGSFSHRWDLPYLVEQGYGLITVYYGDLFADHADGYGESVLDLFSDTPAKRQANGWGAIGAWAWGLSRIMDYIETTSEMDHQRVIVFGHSRLGKAALWAGATDERFAIVVSNNSGCCGAALSRRNFGQTVARINYSYPFWFCPNFQKYSHNESQLPVDQHMLLALMAPRPVYVASGQEDLWADPKGEFLATQNAIPAYRLHGLEESEHEALPEIHQPIGRHVGYHLRQGGHGMTPYDWQQFVRFADQHLKHVKHTPAS